MSLKIHSSPCFELKVFFPYLLCLFNLFKEPVYKWDDKITKLNSFRHHFFKIYFLSFPGIVIPVF